MNVEHTLLKFVPKKSFSVFEGAQLNTLSTLKLFTSKCLIICIQHS